jgi:hypothetical protein
LFFVREFFKIKDNRSAIIFLKVYVAKRKNKLSESKGVNENFKIHHRLNLIASVSGVVKKFCMLSGNSLKMMQIITSKRKVQLIYNICLKYE